MSNTWVWALYAVRAFAMVLLLTTHHPHWLFAFGIVFGLVNFATVAPTQLLVTRYFAGHSVGYMLGLISLAHQLGSVLGAYVPGVLYDLTGSYTVPFVVGVVVLVLAAGQSLSLPQSRAGIAPRRSPTPVASARAPFGCGASHMRSAPMAQRPSTIELRQRSTGSNSNSASRRHSSDSTS